jgi:3-keto-disaccharide hydrolase
MKEKKEIRKIVVILSIAALGITLTAYAALSDKDLSVHSPTRPKPVWMPAPERFGQPPEDAIILDASQWAPDGKKTKGDKIKWKVAKDKNGIEYMEVVAKTGDIHTKKEFGNCQLHIEWKTPVKSKKAGQGFGNSGVFFMNKYEVQILNSYQNPVYADGQAASIYSQVPPLVNVCRNPGEWQSYDVSFLRPIFAPDGKVIRPASITVFHNGVVVHNNYEIRGSTPHKKIATYQPHGEKRPMRLQDHGNPVAFRNIWIRELPEEVPSCYPYIKKPGDK